MNQLYDHSEIAIFESEQKFQLAFRFASIGMALVAIHGEILEANQSLCEMLGYSEQELQQITYQQLTHPDDLAQSQVDTIALINGQVPYLKTERRYLHSKGYYIWTRLTTNVVRSHSGNALYYLAQVENINEQKKSERQITLLTFALDRIHEAAYLMDMEGKFQYVNQEACRMLGLSEQALLSMRISDIDPTFDQASWIEFRKSESMLIESRHRNQQGMYFPVEISSNCFELDGHQYTLALVRNISQRKKAELALRESESKFSALFTMSPMSLSIIAFNSQEIIDVNDVFVQRSGLKKEDIIGKAASEIHPWADTKQRDLFRHQLSTTGQVRAFEAAFNLRGKELATVLISSNLVSVNHLEYIISCVTDITERKRIEAAVAASEKKYRNLVENSSEIFVRYDEQCRRIYISGAYEAAYGIPIDKAINKKPTEAWGRQRMSAREYEAYLRQVMKSGKSAEIELDWVSLDGHYVCHLIRAVPEFNEQQKVVSVLISSRDISAIKIAQRKLMVRELEFRTLLENSPDLIIRYDQECRRTYANPSYLKEFNTDLDHIVDKPLEVQWKVTKPTREEYKASLNQVMKTGEPQNFNLEWLDAKGKKIYSNIVIVPEYWPGGDLKGALGIARNITAIEETKKELAASRKEVQELAAHREAAREEERKHISREIHDNIGQMLSALRMQMMLLRKQPESNSDHIFFGLNRMLTLVDESIKIVRNISTSLHPSVLNSGIASALDWQVSQFVNDTFIDCKLNISEDDIHLLPDFEIAVFRIVQESLNNIAKHANATHVEISLYRKMIDDKEHCQLIIQDNGIGFEYGKKRRKSNTLGLISMRERSSMLGGTFEVISKPQFGTTIKVVFPC